MRTSVLKPGLLVSLKTTIKGGVNYQRVTLEPEHQVGDGTRARWETKREIENAAEFEQATVTRSKARSLISAQCCASSFGLLCPISKEQQLMDAIAEARETADRFNAGAASRVEVYVMVGRIAQDDAEAARAIAAEVRELMSAMQAGIASASPETIREAANKARALGAMLSPDVAGKVSEAIEQARRAAREIVRRIETAGEDAATVVAQLNVSKIEAARFCVLDLDDDGAPIETSSAPARSVDLSPAYEPRAIAAAPSLELEF
jgi:cell division septum initiation protein DivIVA